jgi:hypothetical protein
MKELGKDLGFFPLNPPSDGDFEFGETLCRRRKV